MKITPPSPARSGRRPAPTSSKHDDPDLPPPPLTMPFALARSLDAGSLAKYYGDHLFGMRVWQVGEMVDGEGEDRREIGMEILRGVVDGKLLSGDAVDYDSVLVEGVDCYLAGRERGLK